MITGRITGMGHHVTMARGHMIKSRSCLINIDHQRIIRLHMISNRYHMTTKTTGQDHMISKGRMTPTNRDYMMSHMTYTRDHMSRECHMTTTKHYMIGKCHMTVIRDHMTSEGTRRGYHMTLDANRFLYHHKTCLRVTSSRCPLLLPRPLTSPLPPTANKLKYSRNWSSNPLTPLGPNLCSTAVRWGWDWSNTQI